jgi:hypothetical protein
MTLAIVKGGPLVGFHQGFSRVVLIYSILVAVWGLFLYLRGRNPSGGYLGALVINGALPVVQGLVGLILLGTGHRPDDPLHYLYGVASVLTLPTAYFMSRGGTERRDSLIFGLAALLLVGLSFRAIMTGGSA